MADLALERKGVDLVVIDLRERSTYADFLVIASGTSDRHVRAVAEHVEDELGRRGLRSLGAEGLREGQWALVDLGGVVLHVFHEYTRGVYDLESMWHEAPRLRIEESRTASHVAP